MKYRDDISKIEESLKHEEIIVSHTLSKMRAYNFLSQIMDFCSIFFYLDMYFLGLFGVCGLLSGLEDLGWDTLDVLFL